MKKIYLCLFLTISLVLGGCTQKNEPISSMASSGSQEVSQIQDGSLQTDDNISNPERNDVVNLPSELYQEDQSTSAKYLRYDFEVKEKTELAIAVEVSAGNISLGIKDKNSSDYMYDMKNFSTEADSVTLEEGSYSVVVKKSKFTGNYSIKGTLTE